MNALPGLTWGEAEAEAAILDHCPVKAAAAVLLEVQALLPAALPAGGKPPPAGASSRASQQTGRGYGLGG